MTQINQRAEQCGYFSFMEQALTFPPAGKFTAPNESAPGCDVWDDIVTAAIYVNPCFNIYHLTDFCPFLWDELGFPSLASVSYYYVSQYHHLTSPRVQITTSTAPTSKKPSTLHPRTMPSVAMTLFSHRATSPNPPPSLLFLLSLNVPIMSSSAAACSIIYF